MDRIHIIGWMILSIDQVNKSNLNTTLDDITKRLLVLDAQASLYMHFARESCTVFVDDPFFVQNLSFPIPKITLVEAFWHLIRFFK